MEFSTHDSRVLAKSRRALPDRRCAPSRGTAGFLDRESAGDASLRTAARAAGCGRAGEPADLLDPVRRRSATRLAGTTHSTGMDESQGRTESGLNGASPSAWMLGRVSTRPACRKPLQQPNMRRHSDHPVRLRWFSPQECVLGQPKRRGSYAPVLWAHAAFVLCGADGPGPVAAPARVPPWLSRLGAGTHATDHGLLRPLSSDELRRDHWAALAATGHEAEVLDLESDRCLLRWGVFLVFYGFSYPTPGDGVPWLAGASPSVQLPLRRESDSGKAPCASFRRFSWR